MTDITASVAGSVTALNRLIRNFFTSTNVAKTQSDITAIAGYAGEYAPKILQQVVQNLDIAQDVTVMTGLKTSETLTKYVANDGLRPYDSDVETPSGQAGSWSKRIIDPRTAMKILKIIPEEYRGTFLARTLAANAKDYPGGYAEFFWAVQAKKIADEINRNMYFGLDPQSILPFDPGVNYAVGARFTFDKNYFEVTTTTTAGQTPTSTPGSFKNINGRCLGAGFGTILANEYNSLPAGNKVATGVITDVNAFDKILSMYQAMPSEKQALGGTAFVSYNTYQKFNNSLLTKFNNGTSAFELPGRPGKAIYGSNDQWNIKPCSWLGNSGRIIMTQKENLVMGTDLLSDITTIGKMIETIHGFLAKFQMILANQFTDFDLLYVNDQA